MSFVFRLHKPTEDTRNLENPSTNMNPRDIQMVKNVRSECHSGLKQQAICKSVSNIVIGCRSFDGIIIKSPLRHD